MSNDNNPSPVDVGKKLNNPLVKKSRQDQAIKRAEQVGFQKGLERGRREIIDWLQVAYTGPNAPDRGSVEGDAILKLTRDATLHFRGLDQGRRR